MLRFLYSAAFFLALPLAVLRLLWRSRREPGYRQHIGERFGRIMLPGSTRPRVWVHAVSAGETIAAIPLVRRLVARNVDVVVTNMTPAGRERAHALLASEIEAGRVSVVYVPYDVPMLVSRFLEAATPDLLVLIDTELWPNLIHGTAARGTRIVLANGRLSKNSFEGYSRFAALALPMLKEIELYLMQSASHTTRLLELGVAPDSVVTCGSIKFDNPLPVDVSRQVAAMKERVGNRHILLGASTHAGEESALLEVFADPVFADKQWLLVLAIRHTRRVDEVIELLTRNNLAYQRYSDGADVRAETRIWVIDVMGELLSAYGVANIAFVGGSLVPVGGHNMIEAAMSGVPIVMGSNVANIEDIADEFVERNAMMMVSDVGKLRSAMVSLVRDEVKRNAQIANATALVAQHQGALDTVTAAVIQRIKSPLVST